MPDPIDVLHEGFVDNGVYDESDDPQTRIQKTAAFLAQGHVSPAKQKWILNGVASAAARMSDLGAASGAQHQQEVADTEKQALGQSGLDAVSRGDIRMPFGGEPQQVPLLSSALRMVAPGMLAANRGATSAVASVDDSLRGASNIVAGPGNKFSKFLAKDAGDLRQGDWQLNPTVQKAADVGGAVAPMLGNPFAAAGLGGGASAATAEDMGAGRGAQTVAGLTGAALNYLLPGQGAKLLESAAAPTLVRTIANPGARTVLGDVVSGLGSGAGVAAANTAAQLPTAVDTNSLTPLIEQLKNAPETILMGGLMHPAIAGVRRIGDIQAEKEQSARLQPQLTQATQENAALGRQQQIDAAMDANAKTADAAAPQEKAAAVGTEMTNSRLQDAIASKAEAAGMEPEDALAEHKALTQRWIDQGVEPQAASIQAAKELAGRLTKLGESMTAARVNATTAPALKEMQPLTETRVAPHEVAEAEEMPPTQGTTPVAEIQRAQELERLAKQQPTAHENMPREDAAGEAEAARLAELHYGQARNVYNLKRRAANEARMQEAAPPSAVADPRAAPEMAGAPTKAAAPIDRFIEQLPPERQALATKLRPQADEANDPQGALGNLQQLMLASEKKAPSTITAPAASETIAANKDGSVKVVTGNGKVWIEAGGKKHAEMPDSPALREAYAGRIRAVDRPKVPPQAPKPAEPEHSGLAEGESKEMRPDVADELPANSDEKPVSRVQYRSSLSRRGSFDPVGLVMDAMDAGADTFGKVVEHARDALRSYPSEDALTAAREHRASLEERIALLRGQYRAMVKAGEDAKASGFWNTAFVKGRSILSMEAVAAHDPQARRYVAVVQRMRDLENSAVAENMRDAEPFVHAPAAERPILAKAAFHFIYEQPRASLNSRMLDGTTLSPENQARLQAAFDASNRATKALVDDLNKLKGALPEDLAKFRDVMQELIRNPDNRYIPMRRYGDKVLWGSAGTDAVLDRLGGKSAPTPEEATVLRLAKQAKLAGDDTFTYYYGAAESDSAREVMYAGDASKYEEAAGSKLNATEYNPDYDRAKPVGIKAASLIKLAKDAGIEPQPLLDMLAAIPMRGQTRSSMQSRGIPGYSHDSVRATGEWFTNLASLRAKAGQADNLARAMARVSDPAMRARLQEYTDVQKQPINKLATTGKAFLNLYAMGLRPASAAAEAIGGVIMAPYKLGAIGLPRQAAQSFGEMAMSNASNMWRIAHAIRIPLVNYAKSSMPAQMAGDFQRSADTGRFGNQAFRDEMMQQSKSLMQNMTEKAMILHRNFREANAIGVWKAAYKAAEAGQIPAHAAKALEMQGIDVGTRTPRELADAMVDFTMNRVDKTTMPLWQSQTAVGQIAGTLTSYQTRSLAQMIDIAKVWKNIPETRLYGAGFTAALVAMFGAGALPFGNWLMEADKNLSDDPRSLETRALSENGTRMALYGVTGYAAENIAEELGADKKTAANIGQRFDAFSRRTAWGNFLHENSMSLGDQIPAYSLMTSVGRSMGQAYEGFERDDPMTVMEGLAGSVSLGARDLVKGGRALATGKVVNGRADTVTNEATTGEGIGQLAGFGMNATQQTGADTSAKVEMKNARRTELKRFAYRIANAIDAKKDISDVLEDVRSYNAKYLARNDAVGWAMTIDSTTLDNAVKMAYTREILGAHQAAVSQAKGPESMVLQENE